MSNDGFLRAYPLEDVRILTRAQGSEYADGRTVEALTAVWDTPTEIMDGQGHYTEMIARTAFDRVLDHARPQGSRSSWNVGVFYNHGMNLHGGPGDSNSRPIGAPVDIRADAAGLVTVTRYATTELGDEVLTLLRDGILTGHSFSGRFIKSDPARVPRGGYRAGASGLPNVKRLELGLREYGPTPMPAYADTAVLSIRSFSSSTPNPDPEVEDEDPEEVGTPDDSGPATEDSPAEDMAEHSSRSQELTRAVILRKIAAARVAYPGLREEGDPS